MHAPKPDPSPPEPIPPETLLLAYRSGIFPMADARDDPEVFWVEPRDRAIIALDHFQPSRSLAKIVRQDRFSVTVNKAFGEVIAACAAPRDADGGSWISKRIEASYLALHRLGHAHSIECWRGGELAGGLYGVGFDRVFCGESMFSRADNASKVALTWLVALMRKASMELLDCQFLTDHLASLGAEEIPQAEYCARLERAKGNVAGPGALSLDEAYRVLLAPLSQDRQPPHSSPGKLILQCLTQTS